MYSVSVVIPVYNLENRLGDTLNSLCAQSFRDFEIVVVDDCSRDHSADCAETVLKCSGVPYRVLRHDKNRGVSAARNTGLAAARGKYVIFFDGDDLAEPDFIARLYESVAKHDGDAAFCGYKTREASDGKEKMYPSLACDAELTQDELLRLRLLNKITALLCSAIYKRDFLLASNIVFTEGRIAGEDVEFVTKVIAAGAKTSFVKDCLYIYLQHADMGTRKSEASKEKSITRYLHHTEAHFDEAAFITAHMTSSLSRHLVEDYILPIAYQRMLAVYAARDSKDKFNSMLNDRNVRRTLLQSVRSFFEKPGIFAKSLWILLLPRLYYKNYYLRFNKR